MLTLSIGSALGGVSVNVNIVVLSLALVLDVNGSGAHQGTHGLGGVNELAVGGTGDDGDGEVQAILIVHANNAGAVNVSLGQVRQRVVLVLRIAVFVVLFAISS